ncbi:PriCT-2 domain-containing protein [Lysinibacillus louembei]|uniref:PriCT-2 domain-containing protein n=1 Tax=Lysinibacillus louembei TaxID=1470088 RepID=A0ABZ0RTV0_9BACI|nr:PriCT-2 domain-containing protein [Lysinibacillus louembei]WPK10280.1 PriCT-2 domain-containing protein [Lysinibacillus louembei]
MYDFLDCLYPSDIKYKGSFLLFNIDTKMSTFIDVHDKESIVDYIQAEAAKGYTVQINLALQLEKEAKLKKVGEENTKHEIVTALYKKYIHQGYSYQAAQAERALRSIEQKERELGINLNKKKAELQKGLVSYDTMRQKLNAYSNHDFHGYFKADIEVLTQNILKRVKGTVETVSEVFGLWLDIDVNIEGYHNEQHHQYFDSFQQATNFMMSLPLKPTIIVNSGGGLHVYYKFNEVLRLETIEERKEINLIYRLFSEYVNQEANKIGKKIDKSNVLKMMRVPFTYNLKNKDKPKLVTIEYFKDANQLKYEDVKGFLKEAIEMEQRKIAHGKQQSRYPSDKKADGNLIYERCNWVRHKVDNQHECSYEEWNLLLMLCANIKDGFDKAHEWSRDDARYNSLEVTRKYQTLVEQKMKPFLCNKVNSSSLCKGCDLFNQGKSPIRLGYDDKYKR